MRQASIRYNSGWSLHAVADCTLNSAGTYWTLPWSFDLGSESRNPSGRSVSGILRVYARSTTAGVTLRRQSPPAP
jgi:hypothetical protein